METKQRQKTFSSGIDGEPSKRFCHLPEDNVVKSSISVERKDSDDDTIFPVNFDDRNQSIVRPTQFPDGKYLVQYKIKTEDESDD